MQIIAWVEAWPSAIGDARPVMHTAHPGQASIQSGGLHGKDSLVSTRYPPEGIAIAAACCHADMAQYARREKENGAQAEEADRVQS